eukprot:Skav211050  [mRNA]  locus=scaffold1351:49618:50124:- [translate_table: standard]
MSRHRSHYKGYINNTNKLKIKSFDLFDEFGVDNCKIVWIKNYPCNSKKELEAEEGRIQQETDCVNKRMEGRTKKEWTRDNEERVKEVKKRWEKDNKEHVKKLKQMNYQKDKQRIDDKNKLWYENNKETVLQQRGQICLCNCRSTYTYGHKARHERSNKHQQYLQTLQD